MKKRIISVLLAVLLCLGLLPVSALAEYGAAPELRADAAAVRVHEPEANAGPETAKMLKSGVRSTKPLATVSWTAIDLTGGGDFYGAYRVITPVTITISEEALALPKLDCIIFAADAQPKNSGNMASERNNLKNERGDELAFEGCLGTASVEDVAADRTVSIAAFWDMEWDDLHNAPAGVYTGYAGVWVGFRYVDENRHTEVVYEYTEIPVTYEIPRYANMSREGQTLVLKDSSGSNGIINTVTLTQKALALPGLKSFDVAWELTSPLKNGDNVLTTWVSDMNSKTYTIGSGGNEYAASFFYTIRANSYHQVPAGTYRGAARATVTLHYVEDGAAKTAVQYYTFPVTATITDYAVNVDVPAGVAVSLRDTDFHAVSKARKDMAIAVNYTVTNHYTLTDIWVEGADGTRYELEKNIHDLSFTMPGQDVTVKATVLPPFNVYTYETLVGSADIEGYELTALPAQAAPGEFVTVTASFDPNGSCANFIVKEWKVRSQYGQQVVDIVRSDDHSCTFVMPNFNVNVCTKIEDGTMGTGVIDPGPGTEISRLYGAVLYPNDGSDARPVGVVSESNSVILPLHPFTHEDWVFKGWAFTADATSPDYLDGATVYNLPEGSNLLLYAVWDKATSYTLNVPESPDIPYGQRNTAITLEMSDLVLGRAGNKQIDSLTVSIDTAYAYLGDSNVISFAENGTVNTDLVISGELWDTLAAGEQSFDLVYSVTAYSGTTSVGVIGTGTITVNTVAPVRYAVSVPGTIEGGLIRTSSAYTAFAEGAEVRIDVRNDINYMFLAYSLTAFYTDEGGNVQTIELSLEVVQHTRCYYFTMPPYPVTVSGRFESLVSSVNEYTVTLRSGEGEGDDIVYSSLNGIGDSGINASSREFYKTAGGVGFRLDDTDCPDTFTAPENCVFDGWEGSVGFNNLYDENTVFTAKWKQTAFDVEVRLVDGGGNGLENKNVSLADPDGNASHACTDSDGYAVFRGLAPCGGKDETYTLRFDGDEEFFEASGEFFLDEDGTVDYGGDIDDGCLIFEIVRKPDYTVRILAVDTNSKEAVEGVTVQLLLVEEPIDTWTSGEDYHVTEKLIPGEEYALHVSDAPEYYLASADTVFVIGENGSVTYSGNTTTNMIFETILLVELKYAPSFPLSGSSVMFFDEDLNVLSEAPEGQIVWVSADLDTIDDGLYFTDEYVSDPEVQITVNEVGDGWFTMPGYAVKVDAVLAEREEYELVLTGDAAVALPEDMAGYLTAADEYDYLTQTLDLNGDGEPDVLIDFDNNTAQRLEGADAITESAALDLSAVPHYRYKTVIFVFAEDTDPIVIKSQPRNWKGQPGDHPEIRVTAEGDGLTYQWFWRNAGKTAWNVSSDKDDCYDYYTLNATRNGRQVYCRITDAEGNFVDTEIATMSYDLPEGYTGPVITGQPENWRGVMGDMPCVSVQAEGEGELTYKWYYKDVGKTKFSVSSDKDNCYDSYPLNRTRAGRSLYCVVTDKYGFTVKTVTVTMDFDVPEGWTGPEIVADAESWTGATGEYPAITFTVDGEGVTYRWYWRNAGKTTWNVSSDKDDCYDSYPLTSARNGREVYCVATDKYGFSVTSRVVTMSKAN